VIAELETAMFVTGSESVAELRETDVVVGGATRDYLEQRGFGEL